jgi:hypothetical protein
MKFWIYTIDIEELYIKRAPTMEKGTLVNDIYRIA